MQQNNDRLGWIDFIRGISALLVVIFHSYHFILAKITAVIYPHIKLTDLTIEQLFALYSNSHVNKFVYYLGESILGVIDVGKLGVIMFFGVSGFVIPYSILKYKNNPVKKFILSRFFRLYPIYWVSLVLAIIVPYLIAGIINYKPDIRTVIFNITMFQQFFAVNNVLGLYWTLQIELAFYILTVIYFYFRILENRKFSFMTVIGMILLALIFAVIKYKTGIKMPIAMPLSLAIMFLSMLWRNYLFKENSVNLKSLIYTLVFLVIMLVPVTYIGYTEDFSNYLLTYYLALFIFVLFSGFIRFSNNFFSFMGKISYSIYLMHTIIGFIALKIIIKLGILSFLGIEAGFIMSIFICMLVTVIFSAITYYFIEEKGINLGKKLVSKLL